MLLAIPRRRRPDKLAYYMSIISEIRLEFELRPEERAARLDGGR